LSVSSRGTPWFGGHFFQNEEESWLQSSSRTAAHLCMSMIPSRHDVPTEYAEAAHLGWGP
ncbi:MAG: hypothetical protein QOJ71_202, partial [Actinomycetota bacterium]|nr:hypothetical protein [Actinomycetota bacterium]